LVRPHFGAGEPRTFWELLANAAKRANRFDLNLALLYVDLDGFKPINDQFGHDAGDRVLKGVGERLRGNVRGTDAVARLGGDEFAVLLEFRGDRADVEAAVVNLGNAVEQPIEIDGVRVSVGASFGVAIYPTDAEDLEDLQRMADAAMYRAKEGDLGSCFCTDARGGQLPSG
jgi:diguanylate cyclase (GGDEF)-like protein